MSSKGVSEEKFSSINMLSNEELSLINYHMMNNPSIHLTTHFVGWHDENGDLCVQYSEDVFYHYNVERGEWW